MAVVQITDVPAGMVPVAVVRNDAGLCWFAGTNTFAAYGSGVEISLTETPAGSRQFSATVGVPSGVYTATFTAAGEVVGYDRFTVQGGSLNVVLEPTYTTPPDPVFSGGPIQVYAGESGVIGIPVFDATGSPVTLDPSPVFIAYRDTIPNPTVIFAITAGVSGNTATVTYSNANTATADRLRYELKASSGDVLAQGRFNIIPTV